MRLRAFQRRLSVAVLVTWVISGVGAIVAPHAEGFDVACGDVALVAPGAAIKADSAAADGTGHCDLCHLQRIVRGALPDVVAGAVTAEVAALDNTARAPFLLAGSSFQLPSRAPPTPALL